MNFEIRKSGDGLKQAFGWASVAVRAAGEIIKGFGYTSVNSVALMFLTAVQGTAQIYK